MGDVRRSLSVVLYGSVTTIPSSPVAMFKEQKDEFKKISLVGKK